MTYDADTEARLQRFWSETIPCVGGPCDGMRAAARI